MSDVKVFAAPDGQAGGGPNQRDLLLRSMCYSYRLTIILVTFGSSKRIGLFEIYQLG